MSRHEDVVRQIILNTDDSGRLKSRERNDLEYKESFNLLSWPRYTKTMAAFANNQGGYILFGVKNKPREVVGIDDAFTDFEQEKLTEHLNSMYSPEIRWEVGSIHVQGKIIGYIYTNQSHVKPVIALKQENKEKVACGDIFYRYRARSEKIKYPEMVAIIEDRIKAEREQLLRLLETIRKESTLNLGIINYGAGTMTTPNGADIVLDKELIKEALQKANYIKEGSFHETKGIPVVKITGNIEIAEEIPVPDIEPDIQYPLLQKGIAESLGLRMYDVQALIWYFGMKGKKKFHMQVATSGKSTIHKFSEHALYYLVEKINENKNDSIWLQSILTSYNQRI